MLLSYSVVLALLASQDATGEVPEPPPKRVKVGGVRCLHARSRVVFRSLPDHPHSFELTLAFPDRARSLLVREGARASERQLAFQYGAGTWTIAPGAGESRPIPPEAAAGFKQELALRRALYLWPAGLEWSDPVDGLRSAALAGGGRFEALVADAGALPTLLRALDGDGNETFRFDDIEWTENEFERMRPDRLAFSADGRTLWDEKVLAVDLEAGFVEDWFLPPDRRSGTGRAGATPVQPTELRAGVARRVPLASATSLAEAIARGDALHAEAPPSGSTHADTYRIELDDDARPVAVVLLLAGHPEPVPDAWHTLPTRSAFKRSLAEPSAVGRTDVEALRAAAGEDGGTCFLILGPPAQPRRAHAVLALDD